MSDTPRQCGSETQGATYLRGLSGATPDAPDNFIALEAKEKMSLESVGLHCSRISKIRS
jgi:hypothetical protein